MSRFVLAQVSDLHIDGGRRAADRARRVMRFLEPMAPQLDAVLVTGDIADHGSEAEYDEARLILAGPHRILLCPGNHDDRGAFRKVLLEEPDGLGPINRVHQFDGLRIMMCDSSIPDRDDGWLGDDTLAWLDQELARVAIGELVLVAFHHPPVLLHSPFIDALRQRGAERLAEIIGRHASVAAVLCGHAHTAAASTFADRPLIVAPGVVSTLRFPWEGQDSIDESMPPAIAFHVLEDDGRLTTHFRFVP